jgi:PAS domain S-box-containing protein
MRHRAGDAGDPAGALDGWVKLTGRVPIAMVAVLVMTIMAAVDAALGHDLVLVGLLGVGPCLAAASARPRAVLAIGAYALALIATLSWWPDQLWGTGQQLLFLLATAAVTVVSCGLAGSLRTLERVAGLAEDHRRTLAAVVEHSEDAIIATTLAGVVTSWNAAAERLYGRSAEEAIGLPMSRFVVPVARRDQVDVVSRIVAGERGVNYDAQYARGDGDTVDVSATVSPLFDRRGILVGVSVVTRNITERNRAESRQRLAEERSHQAQRLDSLGQLAGGIAHDFNNLLAVILNYTVFAIEQSADNPPLLTDLTQVQVAAERAASLTCQLLTFTRADTIQPEVVDVNESIAEARAMLARTIGEHIELIAAPAAEPLLIYADGSQIQQVLINLALNARDAMPDGGTLVLEAAPTELEAHQVDVVPPVLAGQYVMLSVSDTGSGMSAEIAAHVFEPFYTTKSKGLGTGLGLATVYGIVTEAGGSINLYSEPGIGTTFRVYFPLVDTLAVLVRPKPEQASALRGNGETILVVEDELALRQVLDRILTAAGYTVLSAKGGPEALALEKTAECDLLLTDIIMPEMSGRELAGIMQRRRPELAVLYMSGYANGLLGSTHILDAGIAFIAKPFTAKELLARIHPIMTDTTRQAATAE